LGRQYSPAYAAFSFFDATDAATAVSPAQSYAGIVSRIDNAITHVIRDVGPVSTYFMYAPGELPGRGSKAGSMLGGMVRYTSGGFDVAVATDVHKTAAAPAHTSLKIVTLGASYTTGPWKFFGVQIRAHNRAGITDFTSPDVSAVDLDGTIGALLPIDQRLYHLGTRWKGGRNSVVFSLARVEDLRPGVGADVDHYGLIYGYDMSARTTMYAAASRANNKGLARVGLNAAGTAGGFTRDFGVDSKAFQAGIRHRF
jgi:hypothetical protein